MASGHNAREGTRQRVMHVMCSACASRRCNPRTSTRVCASPLEYGVNVDAQAPEQVETDPVVLCSDGRTLGSHPTVARPRRRRECTEGRPLDCVAPGSPLWTRPGCGGVTEAWRRSTCPDQEGRDTFPIGILIESEPHADHAIVIRTHRRENVTVDDGGINAAGCRFRTTSLIILF